MRKGRLENAIQRIVIACFVVMVMTGLVFTGADVVKAKQRHQPVLYNL